MLFSGSAFGPCLAAEQTQREALSSQPDLPSPAGDAQAQSLGKSDDAFNEEYQDDENQDDELSKEERVAIDDPLEPFNRTMHQFNDKLYFWLLKPVAQGYKVVVPEPARISVKNFYANLLFPIPFRQIVYCRPILRARAVKSAVLPSTLFGGLEGCLILHRTRTLICKNRTRISGKPWVFTESVMVFTLSGRSWALPAPGQRRYSRWISSGSAFLFHPLVHQPGGKSLKMINNTSLRIGDYEALLEAAIDPYVAIRDGYIQYRMKEVKARKARSLLFHDGDGARPAADEPPKN